MAGKMPDVSKLGSASDEEEAPSSERGEVEADEEEAERMDAMTDYIAAMKKGDAAAALEAYDRLAVLSGG